MVRIVTLLIGLLLGGAAAHAQHAQYYLYYNASSPNLDEIHISEAEVARIFEDEFGPASDELPDLVQYKDFYVSFYPNDGYVFVLNSSFNCGKLGCNTHVYVRDKDGDLMFKDSSFPVKCEKNESDKLLCVKGGYSKKKPKLKKRGPVHYPSPLPEGTGIVKDISGK